MFWYSETTGPRGVDWRPEVHDSDGLAMLNGNGERLWRPLNNPERVMTSSFSDNAPKGYGLLQRDRNFENYEDDGVFYERRPSVWVEPLGDWGQGQVQLVEIPTDDEIHDNIAAYWLSAEAGEARAMPSRSTTSCIWAKDEPLRPFSAGRSRPGSAEAAFPASRDRRACSKIVVDFAGPAISALGKRARTSRPWSAPSSGTVANVDGLFEQGRGQLARDLRLHGCGSASRSRCGCISRKDGVPLTETWLYQFLPVKKPVLSRYGR